MTMNTNVRTLVTTQDAYRRPRNGDPTAFVVIPPSEPNTTGWAVLNVKRTGDTVEVLWVCAEVTP